MPFLLHTPQIVKESRGWSYMFSQLEQGKRQLGFRDYAVSQTSLEQVREKKRIEKWGKKSCQLLLFPITN